MPPPAHGLASRLIAGPTLRTQPDRRLVRLVREGYEAAFEEIVRRYGRQLGRYAAAIVGGRSEDVTQDAFSKALLALRRDDSEIELRPWLYRIVRNTALNDLRSRPAAAAELAETIAGGTTPAEAVERREELRGLIERLRALPEAQRAAIVMRELEGLSHDEIAAALGMSGGAARQAIHRARRALRNGAGLLVPLPLLRGLLAADAPAAAEAAGGVAGVAGVGFAAKTAATTVLVAGTVGAGVAIQEARDAQGPQANARAATEKPAKPSSTAPQPGPAAADGDSSGPGSGGSDRPDGSSGSGSGDGGSGSSGSGSSNSGSGSWSSGSGSSGDGSSLSSGSGDSGTSGSSSSESEGSDSSGSSSGSGDFSTSGSGSSGSDTSGSSGSGPGSGDELDD